MKKYKSYRMMPRYMPGSLDQLLADCAPHGWTLHSINFCGEFRGCFVVIEHDGLEGAAEPMEPEPKPKRWKLWGWKSSKSNESKPKTEETQK